VAFQDGCVLKSIDSIQGVPFIVSLSVTVHCIEDLHPPGHPWKAAVLRKTVKETILL